MKDFNDFVDKQNFQDLIFKESTSLDTSNNLFESISSKITEIKANEPKLTKEDISELLSPIQEEIKISPVTKEDVKNLLENLVKPIVKETLEDDHEEITKEMISDLLPKEDIPLEKHIEEIKPISEETLVEKTNSIIDVLTSTKPISSIYIS